MAEIPTPRSYTQILGSMISTFISKARIKGLKVGGPILTILEAAAQSDTRSTQETFNLLAASSLENSEGTGLQRHAADENTRQFGATFTTGVVTIGDSRYKKVATTLYPGSPPPIVGSSILYVTSIDDFPLDGGQIYIGRGSSNYEGPLSYTTITGTQAPFAINLATGSYTKKFHNTYESVILAQGGDRVIQAGSIVQTPQGNSSDAVSFSTLYKATILDGEISIENVAVVCNRPGTIGRVIAGAVNSFVAPPFTGATVTNPAPFTNGSNVESERDLKNRIRRLRQSRSKGTDLALQQAVSGIVSSEENKQIQSASVVSRIGFPTTVYIDDGTGYEESSEGVALESLTDYASGGETDFQIASPRPVSKAFVKSTLSAPYTIPAGAELKVYVGGVLSRHWFSSDQFPNISNASGYDVAAAINANSSLLFGARTADNGMNVILFAKSDTSESIQIASDGADANLVFGFPSARVDTLRLYKNDVLLNKDGKSAIVYSNPRSSWKPMVNGETLTVSVDGTGTATYTFNDVDFINAKTGYTKVSHRNGLDAWVAVFNAKIPGITASTDGSGLVFTSNAGPSSRAAIDISGGTLVSRGMFAISSANGEPRDYTLNRNTGQIRLATPLIAGDKLTAGTVSNRAFVESAAIKMPINIATAGTIWVLVDSKAQMVPTGIAGSTSVTVAITSPTVTITATGTTPFANVQVGDWIILWDTALNTANRGAWRVSRVDPAGMWVVILSTKNVAQSNVSLNQAGITVVRSDTMIQEIPIGVNANYTAQSLATVINTSLVGASASVSRTNRLRITTNTFDSGDIVIPAIDASLSAIPLPVGVLATSNVPQLGTTISGGSDFGTPTFVTTTTTASLTRAYTHSGNLKYGLGNNIVGIKRLPSAVATSFSSVKGYISTIESVSGNAITLRKAPLRGEWIATDRVYAASPFAIGPNDTLNVVVDGDATAKAFAPAMWRKCSTVGSYGSTITLRDADNSNQSLAVAWGWGDVTPPLKTNFADFAVFMKPRVQTHLEDTTKTILWRYNRVGADGMNSTVRYEYPTLPSQGVEVTVDPYTSNKTDIVVKLSSGANSPVTGLHSVTNLGSFQMARTGNAPYPYYLIAGLQISRLSRDASGNVTVTVVFPDAGMNLGANPLGIAVGQSVYVSPTATGTSFDGTAGFRQITAVSAGAAPYTFTYNDGLTTVETVGDGTSASNIGTMSYDSVGVATWAGVTVGNVISFATGASLPSSIENTPLKVTSVDPNSRWIKVESQAGGASSTTIAWGSVVSLDNVSNFPIPNMQAQQLVAAVNGIPNCIVSGASVGSGTGIVNLATWDEKDDLTFKYSFVDGLNYVRTSTAPVSVAGDYTFTLKSAVNANLTSYNDWANEEVYLVPITASTISTFLNSPAVGGLFGNSEIKVSSQNSKLQLATNTAGSKGAISVLGGTANSALAGVVGSAGVTADGLASYVYIRSSEITGFYGNNFVKIENAIQHRKNLTASLSEIVVADGLATFTFGSNIRTHTAFSTQGWQIEKHGIYMAVTWDGFSGTSPSFTGYVAGDYVTLSGASLASGNTGTFQICAIDESSNKTIWVYNPNCVEQVVAAATATVDVATNSSVMPGDTLVIGGDDWGVGNRGVYTVLSVTNNSFVITGENIVPITGPIAATGLNQIVSGTASTLVKKIRSITPHPTEPSLMVVVFEDAAHSDLVSANYGSILKAQDKLSFGTNVCAGADAYAHSTGLIAEAVKVLYGDPRDTDTYPGYVSSGFNVGVSGPIVRRLNISIAVRMRGGAGAASIFSAVKSAVASVVNSSKIGESIPFSDIVNAASDVNGVYAVTILSPTYGNGSDVISIQPYEKAMILNVDSDVQVTIAGS